MYNNDNNNMEGTAMIKQDTPKNHKIAFGLLAGGLVIALGANGYLISRSNDLTEEIARTRAGASTEISKLHEATDTAIEQQQQSEGQY